MIITTNISTYCAVSSIFVISESFLFHDSEFSLRYQPKNLKICKKALLFLAVLVLVGQIHGMNSVGTKRGLRAIIPHSKKALEGEFAHTYSVRKTDLGKF